MNNTIEKQEKTIDLLTEIKEVLIENNQEKVIELLEEIKEILEEIRNKEPEPENDEETYNCDNCDEENQGEPYESINEFTFCSALCYNEWKQPKN